MSAELLRKAAALMRQRAEAAIGDPPTAESWYRAEEIGDVLAGGAIATEAQASKDAPHIASWHPAVALAVADWLDSVAAAQEPPAHDGSHKGRTVCLVDEEAAISIARAYLGEQP